MNDQDIDYMVARTQQDKDDQPETVLVDILNEKHKIVDTSISV